MFKSLLARAGAFRRRLTHLDNQPLSKAAVIVLVFLDVFILSSIFDGLDVHTRQLQGPEQRIPQLCQDIVLNGNWNPSSRLENLTRLVVTHNTRPYTPPADPAGEGMYPLCQPVMKAYAAIRDDSRLAQSLRQYSDTQRESQALRGELERGKGAYDTRLLENIAGQGQTQGGGADVSAIGKRVTGATSSLNEQARRLTELEASLGADPKVRLLFDLVERIGPAERDALRDELRAMNFWHPVKRLAMELAFLLPVLIAFYVWNARSIDRGSRFQVLVSSHLLVVVCIPVLFRVMRLVYDIIPHRLIRQVIELLEHYRLVALWHYFVMLAAILAALGLIYFFQKKLFSQEKLMLRRIARGQCQACGMTLPAGSRHCPGCGAAQYRNCTQCGQPTFVRGRHCAACGTSIETGESP